MSDNISDSFRVLLWVLILSSFLNRQNSSRCLILLSVFIVTLFMACEKEYPWEYHSSGIQRMVVDGILTDEYREHCIRLSHTREGLNTESSPLSGASVIVYSDDSIMYYFDESESQAGSYYSDPFMAVINKEYKLSIIYKSDTVEASAGMVSVTPLGEINISESDEGNTFRYNPAETGQPSMTEVFYDWSEIPEYCENYGSCTARETFYVLNNVDVNQIFSANKKIIYFPAGTILIRRKYGLTEIHRQFIRSLLMETEWSGGLFDVQHGNIPSNLSNGALGFFGVCSVVSDTTRFN